MPLEPVARALGAKFPLDQLAGCVLCERPRAPAVQSHVLPLSESARKASWLDAEVSTRAHDGGQVTAWTAAWTATAAAGASVVRGRAL